MRLSSAYSRHSARTGHAAHTRCAVSTPVPSEGKNSAGLIPRHRAWNIHAYSSGVSSTVTSTSTNPTPGPTVGWFAGPHCCHGFFTSLDFLHESDLPPSTTFEGREKVASQPRSVLSANSQILRETLKGFGWDRNVSGAGRIHGSSGPPTALQWANRRCARPPHPFRRRSPRQIPWPHPSRTVAGRARRRRPASVSSRSSPRLIGAFVGGGIAGGLVERSKSDDVLDDDPSGTSARRARRPRWRSPATSARSSPRSSPRSSAST